MLLCKNLAIKQLQTNYNYKKLFSIKIYKKNYFTIISKVNFEHWYIGTKKAPILLSRLTHN